MSKVEGCAYWRAVCYIFWHAVDCASWHVVYRKPSSAECEQAGSMRRVTECYGSWTLDCYVYVQRALERRSTIQASQ